MFQAKIWLNFQQRWDILLPGLPEVPPPFRSGQVATLVSYHEGEVPTESVDVVSFCMLHISNVNAKVIHLSIIVRAHTKDRIGAHCSHGTHQEKHSIRRDRFVEFHIAAVHELPALPRLVFSWVLGGNLQTIRTMVLSSFSPIELGKCSKFCSSDCSHALI